MIDYLPKANHPPFLTGVGDGALRVTMNRLFSTLTQEQVDKHRHIEDGHIVFLMIHHLRVVNLSQREVQMVGVADKADGGVGWYTLY